MTQFSHLCFLIFHTNVLKLSEITKIAETFKTEAWQDCQAESKTKFLNLGCE